MEEESYEQAGVHPDSSGASFPGGSGAKEEQERGSAFPFADWDAYGGWVKKKFRKTGWFHVERENGRYWLADPEGNAFLSAGLDCINPGEGTRLGPVLPFVERR